MEPLATRGAGRSSRSASRSPTSATSAAPTACRPRGWSGSARDEILSFEEIARLVGVLARVGVDEVRLTGGEPLVRRDLPTLVGMLARDRGRPRPVADDERRAPRPTRRPARGSRPAAPERLARLAQPRPVRGDHPPGRARRGPARARGSGALPGATPDQGQLRRRERLHGDRGSRARGARAAQAVRRPLHRVHAARRRRGLARRTMSSRVPRSGRSSSRSTGRSSSCRRRRRRPRVVSDSPTARASSASSIPSRSRSAPAATESGSPRTASSARAFSHEESGI